GSTVLTSNSVVSGTRRPYRVRRAASLQFPSTPGPGRTVTAGAERKPGARLDDARTGAEQFTAPLAQRRAVIRIELGDIRAGRPDAQGVGLPPVVEIAVGHPHAKRPVPDLAQPGRDEQLV